jgi:hypothetical protein
VENCGKVCSLTELVKHLKGHIDRGVKILCPVVGCGRPMAKKSTFTSHLSVKHGSLSKQNVMSVIPAESVVTDLDTDVRQAEEFGTTAECGEAVDEVEYDSYGIDKNALMGNLSMFFLKLQCNHFIPVCTVQVITSEIWNLHKLGMDSYLKMLKVKLISCNT